MNYLKWDISPMTTHRFVFKRRFSTFPYFSGIPRHSTIVFSKNPHFNRKKTVNGKIENGKMAGNEERKK